MLFIFRPRSTDPPPPAPAPPPFIPGDQQIYLEKPHVFYEDIPEAYEGFRIMMPIAGHQAWASSETIRFNISQSSTIYVLWDFRINQKSSWLDSTWNNTGQKITGSDGVERTFFGKSFSSGTVTLRGNERKLTCATYTVFVPPGPTISNMDPEYYAWVTL